MKKPILLASLFALSLSAQALEKTYIEAIPFSQDDNIDFAKSMLVDKVIKRASDDAGLLYLSANKMVDGDLTSSISVISSAYVKIKEKKVDIVTINDEPHLQITSLVFTDESFIKKQGHLLDKALFLTDNIENSLAKIEYNQKKISKTSTERALALLAEERKKLEKYRAALKSVIDNHGFSQKPKINNAFVIKGVDHEYRQLSIADKAIAEKLADNWFKRITETVIKPLEQSSGVEIKEVFLHENQAKYRDSNADYSISENNHLYRYIKDKKRKKAKVAILLKYVQADNAKLLTDLLSEWFVVSENKKTGKAVVAIDKSENKSTIELAALYLLKEKYDSYKWKNSNYEVFFNNTYMGSIKAFPNTITTTEYSRDYERFIKNAKLTPYKHSKVVEYNKGGFVWYSEKGLQYAVKNFAYNNPLQEVLIKKSL